MTEDPLERLERAGRRAVPAIDDTFAERLESKLRVEHAQTVVPRRRRIAALAPRLGIALTLVAFGVIAMFAAVGRDGGLPVSVVDDDPVAPATAPDNGEADQPGTAAELATATTTPTAAPEPQPATESPTGTPEPAMSAEQGAAAPSPVPSALVAPTTRPEPLLTQTPAPVQTPAPTQTPALIQTPAPIQTPTPTQTPTPMPTAAPTPTRPAATSTPTPAAVQTQTPVQVPSATATPVSEPSPTPEPAPIDLACQVRVVDEVAGVICTWTGPQADAAVEQFQVLRARNGADAQVVSRQRASVAARYVDRDVDAGDEVIYLVRGLDADGAVVGASVRQVVDVPSSG